MADSRVGLTIEEVLDRVEINDLLVRYCAALRTKDLTLLDEVFSPDAMIDYTRIGGNRAGVEATKTWLSMLLDAVARFDLYVGDSAFEFAADRSSATVSTTWHGLFVPANDDPVLQVYGHYEDRLIHTDVWRIAERVDLPAARVIASLDKESSASTT
jgi:hypothetical protein